MDIKVERIEIFNSNKEWLRSLTRYDGKRLFSDKQVDRMTETTATKIAKAIVTE